MQGPAYNTLPYKKIFSFKYCCLNNSSNSTRAMRVPMTHWLASALIGIVQHREGKAAPENLPVLGPPSPVLRTGSKNHGTWGTSQNMDTEGRIPKAIPNGSRTLQVCNHMKNSSYLYFSTFPSAATVFLPFTSSWHKSNTTSTWDRIFMVLLIIQYILWKIHVNLCIVGQKRKQSLENEDMLDSV